MTFHFFGTNIRIDIYNSSAINCQSMIKYYTIYLYISLCEYEKTVKTT